MQRASRFFSDDERAAIEAAVAQAERCTRGEIVPVIATASGRYDRAEDLFGVVVALVGLSAAWWGWQGVDHAGTWGSAPVLRLGLASVVSIVLVGFLVGAVAATLLPVLRLPFIGAAEMRAEVERSAAAAFQRLRVHGSAAGSGVLIYVSLFERMVHVVADEPIAAAVPAAEWETVCRLAVDGLRDGRGAEGLAAAIHRCGEVLATHLPLAPGDRNEFSNALRIID